MFIFFLNTKQSSHMTRQIVAPIILIWLTNLQLSFADVTVPEYIELTLNENTAISITKFGESGDRILWIPTEYGINKEKHYDLLTSLSGFKHEVWLANLHESYFIPSGRSSYTKVPVDDIAELIEKSIPADERKLFIASTGRGAALSLMAINRWQSITSNINKFAGVIMIHPNFQADTPAPGTAMQYLPIIDSTQLPIFILQPEKSNKYWYLTELVDSLSDAGSQVYTKVIQQVSDGYHVRPDATDTEIQLAKNLPRQIKAAINLLTKTKVVADKKHIDSETWTITAVPELLQIYPENPPAPALALQDIEGKRYNLKDHQGKVIVLNFWATWCPPCVEEIPSLGRLQKAFSKDDLLVWSVDIGESKNEVEKFLNNVQANFPVLLNSEGDMVKQWQIIAFPTTFIIDRHGNIKLTYFGGLEWDNPVVIKQIQAVVDP
ncbi:MAG: hypothetical protein DRQ44_05540 [Gammaproteobacteria bacterium]|nr:MAG: hypothetical protein DRQ44_05540 [Gammaproteobacteria bacterium]